MGVRRRETAEDVWNRSEPAIGKKVSPQEAFPQLASLRVEVEEQGRVPPFFRKGLVTLEWANEYKSCHNKVCFGGGYCLGDLIRTAVNQRSTKFTTTVRCEGYEGSPKGRKRYRSCINTFKISMHLIYKDAAIEEN